MTARTDAPTAAPAGSPSASVSRVYTEGMVAGLLGAATIALFYLVLDALNGRPLYTPTVLGTALFRRGAGPPLPEVLPDTGMVLMFTWVHALAFVVVGGLIAHLLMVIERHPGAGFGILLLFVILEFGFVVGALVFARPVLQALAWPTVLVANLLAAAVMVVYFRFRHPTLHVEP